MGLTDFAQKINYQRALQGELERTIMMAAGIERARVHLALPERSLLRTDRSAPKAAVEVVPRRAGRWTRGVWRGSSGSSPPRCPTSPPATYRSSMPMAAC
ncbi:hypothetical protein AB5I41_22725 [Sphingomonas sp. MMS24-JH45]